MRVFIWLLSAEVSSGNTEIDGGLKHGKGMEGTTRLKTKKKLSISFVLSFFSSSLCYCTTAEGFDGASLVASVKNTARMHPFFWSHFHKNLWICITPQPTAYICSHIADNKFYTAHFIAASFSQIPCSRSNTTGKKQRIRVDNCQ